MAGILFGGWESAVRQARDESRGYRTTAFSLACRRRQEKQCRNFPQRNPRLPVGLAESTSRADWLYPRPAIPAEIGRQACCNCPLGPPRATSANACQNAAQAGTNRGACIPSPTRHGGHSVGHDLAATHLQMNGDGNVVPLYGVSDCRNWLNAIGFADPIPGQCRMECSNFPGTNARHSVPQGTA